MESRIALVAGATGLVGKQLVQLLLEDAHYQQVKVVVRRSTGHTHPKLKELVVTDFEKLGAHAVELEAHDYYCTLGTTIRQAGSRAVFEQVDLIYPLRLASLAQRSSIFQQYLIVTAAGANATSPIFYNRVKGRVELELRQMGLRSLSVFRPSLLLGERSERRFGESVGKLLTGFLSFFFVGKHKGLLSIHAREVARAMLVVAHRNEPGARTISSSEMISLARH